jgi:galactokinase
MTPERAAQLLRRLGAGTRGACFIVPGRIEVLGKHTDYAGGRSLLCATERGFAMAVAPADDHQLRITDASSGQSLDLARPPTAGAGSRWRIYPDAVLRRVRHDFHVDIPPCQLLFESDLPNAAGLSSSSAFVVAVFLALDAVAGISRTERYRSAIRSPEDLAAYLAAVERGTPFAGLGGEDGGVGTRGGGEDHTAILCANPGEIVRYAFEPTRREGAVALPDGWSFVVAASGVRAPKAGAARHRYNRLSDLAAGAARVWRGATGGAEPHLGAIADTGPDALARLGEMIRDGAHAACANSAASADLDARVRHFAAESETLVPAAHDSLAAGDPEEFGRLVDRSQELADRLLGNQVPETRWLAAEARQRGAAAASSFGAGFGGSVWALVPRHDAARFLEGWRTAYEGRWGARRHGVWFETRPAAPARRLV